MDIIQKIRSKARSRHKTVALPEYKDERVREAAQIIEKEGIAKVVLLTPDKIDHQTKERYAQEYFNLRKGKIEEFDIAKKIMDDELYYAAMMAREGKVDGFVAGAAHTTSEVARAAIQCLEIDERVNIASSCFIMSVPHCPYGENGTFVFADCGIVPEPNPRQLACIAFTAAELAKNVLDFPARLAMLSYSTKGSAKGRNVEKVREALKMLKELAPDLPADGELQVDTAIVPEVSNIKYPNSPLGGRANVLIFPDLESGNISYKLVQRLADARAVGPLLLGLSKPCSDLSRGCSVDDVIDCVAVTAIRAK